MKKTLILLALTMTFSACAENIQPSNTTEESAANTVSVGVVESKMLKTDKIMVTSPLPGATVMPPLEITGEARGTWFFEASFPVKIVSKEGDLIAETYAQAEGEWMTEEFVPFKATVKNFYGSGQEAILVLQKDNPTGLPEHDEKVEMPIVLGKTGGPKKL